MFYRSKSYEMNVVSTLSWVGVDVNGVEETITYCNKYSTEKIMNTNGNELPKTLVRWGLLCTSILFFQPTWAQDNPAVDPDGTAELDKIEVTGSRLGTHWKNNSHR